MLTITVATKRKDIRQILFQHYPLNIRKEKRKGLVRWVNIRNWVKVQMFRLNFLLLESIEPVLNHNKYIEVEKIQVPEDRFITPEGDEAISEGWNVIIFRLAPKGFAKVLEGDLKTKRVKFDRHEQKNCRFTN